MSKKNTNIMACGCAVIVEQDGKMMTSADVMVSTLQRLFSRSNSRQAQSSIAASRA